VLRRPGSAPADRIGVVTHFSGCTKSNMNATIVRHFRSGMHRAAGSRELRTNFHLHSAVDLKFLSDVRHARHRNFKSKNRTGIIILLVHLLIPKFAREDVAE
jgi:hypothetical protein